MAKTLTLELDGSALEFVATRLLVAGYTGRDQEQVRKHIAELQRQGIPAPPSVPTVYPLDVKWVTTESELSFSSPHVSGEAEPALLFVTNDLDDALVSVMSDFTDRDEERRSIAQSKIQPKPLSKTVWRYRDVAKIWDEIALRSWVERGASQSFYQTGKLKQLLAPAELLSKLPGIGADLQGTVMLMGTLPLCSGEFAFTDYFRGEMESPGLPKLSYECSVRQARTGPDAEMKARTNA
jgi:hypothetical protein